MFQIRINSLSFNSCSKNAIENPPEKRVGLQVKEDIMILILFSQLMRHLIATF